MRAEGTQADPNGLSSHLLPCALWHAQPCTAPCQQPPALAGAGQAAGQEPRGCLLPEPQCPQLPLPCSLPRSRAERGHSSCQTPTGTWQGCRHGVPMCDLLQGEGATAWGSTCDPPRGVRGLLPAWEGIWAQLAGPACAGCSLSAAIWPHSHGLEAPVAALLLLSQCPTRPRRHSVGAQPQGGATGSWHLWQELSELSAVPGGCACRGARCGALPHVQSRE